MSSWSRVVEEPAAATQAVRTAVVGQRRRRELLGDLDDPVVVEPAGLAAQFPANLRVPGDLADRLEVRREAVAVEPDDLVGRRVR